MCTIRTLQEERQRAPLKLRHEPDINQRGAIHFSVRIRVTYSTTLLLLLLLSDTKYGAQSSTRQIPVHPSANANEWHFHGSAERATADRDGDPATPPPPTVYNLCATTKRGGQVL